MRRFYNIVASIFLVGLVTTMIAALIIVDFDVYWVTLALACVFVVDWICTFLVLASKTKTYEIKVAWIFSIWALPIVGIFVFGVFGFAPMERKKIRDYKAQHWEFLKQENYDYTKDLLAKNDITFAQSMFRYVFNTSGRPIYANNRIELITTGPQYLETFVNMIRKATSFVHIAQFIIADGQALDIIYEELKIKVSQGVKVKIIYDWVGCFRIFSRRMRHKFRAAGIEMLAFNWSANPFHGGNNYRNHKKMIIVDNKVAMVGGYNIGDEYVSINKRYGVWSDANLYVEGEIVNSYNLIFMQDWISNTKGNYLNFKSLHNKSNSQEFEHFPFYKSISRDEAQVLDSGPNHQERLIKDMVVKAISQSQTRVWITTPYLLPTSDIMTALKVAALSGVDVRLFVPRVPDNKKYMTLLNRANYPDLLNAGVKIFELGNFIHSKVWIIDRSIGIVGSFNLDYRSLHVNFEIATLVTSRSFIDAAEIYFRELETNSVLVKEDGPESKITFWKKVYMGCYQIFIPLL